jgi:hypothetical protein
LDEFARRQSARRIHPLTALRAGKNRGDEIAPGSSDPIPVTFTPEFARSQLKKMRPAHFLIANSDS